MTEPNELKDDSPIDITEYELHLFLPFEVKDGRMKSDEYDTDEVRKMMGSWCDDIHCKYQIHAVTLYNLVDIVKELSDLCATKKCVVVNFCDATEKDGFPGASVPRNLENFNIPYTGPNEAFQNSTVLKTTTKKALDVHSVCTAPWIEATHSDPLVNLELAANKIGYPFIIKPSYGAASQGIQDKSVVWDYRTGVSQVEKIRQMKYNGSEAIYCEKFIIGREFTALVRGDVGTEVEVYPVVEREFNPKVPMNSRFLTFDKYWGIHHNDETPLSAFLDPGEYFYRYALASEDLQPKLSKVAHDAYVALGGNGYARVDMRMEVGGEGDPKVYVLEINAPCGLSTGDGYTSASWIFEYGKIPFSSFFKNIIIDGIRKNEERKKKKQTA